jgi:hypothetical protein
MRNFDSDDQLIHINRGRHEKRLFDLRAMGTGQPPLETVRIVDDSVLRACEGARAPWTYSYLNLNHAWTLEKMGSN